MQVLKLPYGTGSQEVSLPDDWNVLWVKGAAVPEVPSVERALVEALEQPIGSPPLGLLLPRSGKILLLLSDRTRKDGKKHFLPPLLAALERNGIEAGRVDLCFCRGTHREMTRAELAQMVPEEILSRHAFFQHDCDGDVRELGVTSRGTPVAFNARLWDYQLLLPITGVTHHYIPGFGGGRKIFLPGVAARKTIQGSHELVFRPEAEGGGRRPGVAAGVLAGNAVHEDFVEAVKMLDLPIFLLALITGSGDGKFLGFFGGDLLAAHEEACRRYLAWKSFPFRDPYRLVLSASGGFPSDTNLVQAHKGLDSAFRLVEPGATIIHLSACEEGLGGEDLMRWIPIQGLGEMERRLRERFAIYGNTVWALKTKAAAARIFFVSRLPAECVRQCGMIPAATLAEAFTLARADLPAAPATAVFPNAGGLLPVRKISA